MQHSLSLRLYVFAILIWPSYTQPAAKSTVPSFLIAEVKLEVGNLYTRVIALAQKRGIPTKDLTPHEIREQLYKSYSPAPADAPPIIRHTIDPMTTDQLKYLQRQKDGLLKRYIEEIGYSSGSITSTHSTEDFALLATKTITRFRHHIKNLETDYKKLCDSHPELPKVPLFLAEEQTALEALVTEYALNAHPIEAFKFKRKCIVSNIIKEIERWGTEFNSKTLTPDDKAKKQAEILTIFDDQLATLKAQPEFAALATLTKTISLITEKEHTKIRRDIILYIDHYVAQLAEAKLAQEIRDARNYYDFGEGMSNSL